ncbi:MAG: hypothetical protein ABIW76_23985 [Fibrobacteria bacterium]
MDLEYLPLLKTQRDLYRLPRGMERFREYLGALIDKDADDIKVPLANLNPMGKDHVPAFLDALIAIDADGAASAAVDRARQDLRGLHAEPAAFRVCLVATDDLLGGWTHRFSVELDHIRDQRTLHKRGWITVPLWTSESYASKDVMAQTLAALHRCALTQRAGYPGTLGEILSQETAVYRAVAGYSLEMPVAAMPGADEIAYTEEILRPLLGATDEATLIAALFGDAAAQQLGHAPLGLSARAGLALALTGVFKP